MKNVTSLRIFVVGSFAVMALWCLYAFFNYGHSLEQAGQFGDKFGALNTLFTGLASVGVVAALWHEREGAADREREHRELIAAMTEQANASQRAAEVQATIWQIQHLLGNQGYLISTGKWDGQAAVQYAALLEKLEQTTKIKLP